MLDDKKMCEPVEVRAHVHCFIFFPMAHALTTATRMAPTGECNTVHVRLNKRAKTATLDGCVYKQLFVNAKYEVAAYVVQEVEKLTSLAQCASLPLLQVPVPVALTSKLLVAPLIWVHAHPPHACDVLFLKSAWERALLEHAYPPLKFTKDTLFYRGAPPMLRLHLSPNGAVVASTATTSQAARPVESKKVVSKPKKKCAPKKKRQHEDEEEGDGDEEEEGVCKASEDEEDEIEEEDEEEYVQEQEEEIEEDNSTEEREEDELDEGGDNEEFEEEEDESENTLKTQESDADDRVNTDEEEEEERVPQGRTKKRTKG